MYKSFGDEIYNIGEEIVRCPLRCRAVVNHPEKGIIPRGLIFEDDGSGKLGCIIVGINPGNADEEEREYLRRKPTYRAWLEYWEERFKDKKYYKKAKELAGELLGFKGSILWTELCKCEKSREVPKAPPISTLVTCMKRFLDREMKLVKEFFGKNIPIIALGRRTFEAVCFRYSDHFTVGVPHPTGSYGDFNKLYSLLESPKNLAKVKSLIDESKNNKENCVEIFRRNLERIKIYSLHE